LEFPFPLVAAAQCIAQQIRYYQLNVGDKERGIGRIPVLTNEVMSLAGIPDELCK
jgi:hypothetical protein